MGWIEPALERALMPAAAVGARVSMLMVFAPFFGSLAIPARVKAGLVVAFTALLYPAYAPRWTFDLTTWLPLVLREAAVGLMLGLAVHFVFEGVQLAGQMVGFQMGFSLANVVSPESEVETPVVAIFQQTVALLIFVQVDGPQLMLRALARSLTYLPPGAIVLPPPAVEGLIQAAGGMLLVAVQLAAPVLVATLMADVALGFLGKASPQLPVLFVGLSAKNVIGLGVLITALAFWPSLLGEVFARAVATAERLMHLASL
jgi:flagellar biosynthetic protein FliR